jgi:hypothetical protein
VQKLPRESEREREKEREIISIMQDPSKINAERNE